MKTETGRKRFQFSLAGLLLTPVAVGLYMLVVRQTRPELPLAWRFVAPLVCAAFFVFALGVIIAIVGGLLWHLYETVAGVTRGIFHGVFRLRALLHRRADVASEERP